MYGNGINIGFEIAYGLGQYKVTSPIGKWLEKVLWELVRTRVGYKKPTEPPCIYDSLENGTAEFSQEMRDRLMSIKCRLRQNMKS